MEHYQNISNRFKYIGNQTYIYKIIEMNQNLKLSLHVARETNLKEDNRKQERVGWDFPTAPGCKV